MSSEPAVAGRMPAVITLDDLTAMMTTDEFHRYELSPEGVLSVLPPHGYAHAVTANRLTSWLGQAGVPLDRFAQAVGLRIAGDSTVGGRIPDLTVWSRAQTDGVWLPPDDVLLVVEMISSCSVGMDTVTKRAEYAGAGIPQYWMVAQDPAETVTMFRLDGDHYAVQAIMSLAWLLTRSPQEHGLG